MDERKSVYAVVSDEQMSRVRDAMEDVTSLVDSLRLGCEIAYRREPTQAEGDAHEYRHDQSMGASYGASECFVPMGGHHGWRCKCGVWVWGGPTVCQRCVDREAVKVALEWKAEADHLRKVFDDAGQAGAPMKPDEQNAEAAYLAYAVATGGHTHDGKPMPRWADLPARVQGAWAAAAEAVCWRAVARDAGREG